MPDIEPPVIREILVTHNGTFHADDCFVYAALRLAMGLRTPGQDHVLIRTRDPDTIAGADMVWDVGGVFDPGTDRFDHHQKGAPTREDGTPFSSAGLMWQHWGVTVVLGSRHVGSMDQAREVARYIDDDIVRTIDAIDNGVRAPDDTLGLSSIVDDFNPRWDSGKAGSLVDEDTAFLAASAVVEGFLVRRIEAAISLLSARNEVESAFQTGTDTRILELQRKMPWQEAAFSLNLPTIYAVYPVAEGGWMVDAMPMTQGSYEQRLPLPMEWGGLRNGELAAVSGIRDAIFTHVGLFVGAASSREGAMSMALASLALNRSPAPGGTSP